MCYSLEIKLLALVENLRRALLCLAGAGDRAGDRRPLLFRREKICSIANSLLSLSVL